jgi:Ca2+-binding EF-hand superfamily protein
MIREVDINGDGRLDLDEFRKMLASESAQDSPWGMAKRTVLADASSAIDFMDDWLDRVHKAIFPWNKDEFYQPASVLGRLFAKLLGFLPYVLVIALYNFFELPTITHAAIIAADIGLDQYLLLVMHSHSLLASTLISLVFPIILSYITVALLTRGTNMGHWLMGYTAMHSHPGIFNGAITTADNSPCGLRRNLLRLYAAPLAIFSILCVCTLLSTDGYRLDTSEQRAEALSMVGTTFLFLNFTTAAWSLLTEGSPRTLADIISGTTVVTTRSMLPEHIKIRRQRHFGLGALLVCLVLVVFSIGTPAFVAQRARTGKMSIPEEERMCIPALCVMGITSKAKWFHFQDTAAKTLKDKKIYAKMEECTHKLLEKTDTISALNTFEEPTTRTTSVDIATQCTQKMSWKSEIHDLFESVVPVVRPWLGLNEATASHPERVMRTALQLFTDTDYDGSIDKEEFMDDLHQLTALVKKKFKALGKSTANIEKRLVDEFDDLDTNNDGAVDKDELLSRESAIADVVKEAEGVSAMDTNNDGLVDSSELATGLSMSEQEASTLIQQADTDGDGKLNVFEFIAASLSADLQTRYSTEYHNQPLN